MTVKRIIQESLDANPLGLKEAFVAAIQARIAEALENKIAEFNMNEGFVASGENDLDESAEQIDELKKSTLASYIGASSADKSFRAHEMGKQNALGRELGRPRDADFDSDSLKHRNRSTGIQRAANKLAKEEVDLEEGNADNKLKKNVFTAKLGNTADVTRSNYNSKELKPFTSRNGSGDSRPALKNAVGKMLRAGRAELKHGKDAGFVQTLNDFGKNVREEIEQIDEISKGLATAYSAKAKRTLRPLQNKLDMGLPNSKAMKMTNKRSSGILKAADKLSGSAKINATEDLDEAQVKKPTAYEKDVALVDGKPNTSAKMGVNKLAYALDKSDNKKVTLPKMPWDK